MDGRRCSSSLDGSDVRNSIGELDIDVWWEDTTLTRSSKAEYPLCWCKTHDYQGEERRITELSVDQLPASSMSRSASCAIYSRSASLAPEETAGTPLLSPGQ